MKTLSNYIREGYSNVPAITGFHLGCKMNSANAKKLAGLMDQINGKFPEVIKDSTWDSYCGHDVLAVTGNLFYTYQFVSDALLDKLFAVAPVTRVRFRNLTPEARAAIEELCAKRNVEVSFTDQNGHAVVADFEPGLSRKCKLTPGDLYLRLQ